MKNILIIVIGILLAIACKEPDKLEIVPDLESDYIPEKYLDEEPDLKGDDEVQTAELAKLLKIFEENDRSSDTPIYYFFDIKLFVNEAGRIDKIKYAQNKFEYEKKINEKKSQGATVNPSLDKLFSSLTEYFKTVELNPGQKDGLSVKSVSDVEISIKVNESYKADIYLDLNFGLAKKESVNKDDYFVTVDGLPKPIGGMAALQKNIVYPELAKKAGIQGRVFIKAFIDTSGNVVRAEVLKGIGGGCDAVAIDAVKATKFSPGVHEGKKVPTQVSIPILFRLK